MRAHVLILLASCGALASAARGELTQASADGAGGASAIVGPTVAYTGAAITRSDEVVSMALT